MKDKLVTIKELSEKLGIAIPTLYQWKETGKIPSIKCGGKLVRFELDEVLARLKNSQEKTKI